MNGPQHLMVGAVAAGVVVGGAQAAGVPVTLTVAGTGAAVAGLGALAPDIDHPSSLIGNRIPAALLVTGIAMIASPWLLRLSAAQGGMFSGVWEQALQASGPLPRWGLVLSALSVLLLFASFKVTATMEHRGPLHSVAAAAIASAAGLVTCLIFGLTPLYAILLGVGWSTHLLADATTPIGLPYLAWPLASSRHAAGSRLLPVLVVLILLLGAWSWFSVAQSLLPAAASASGTEASSAADPRATSPVDLLREIAPDVAGKVVEPENPEMEIVGSTTRYTWVYLDQPAQDRVDVRQVVLTVNESGRPLGVEYP